jgi:F-type H+-transporting ATPase subunit a
MFLQVPTEQPSVQPETLFHIGQLPFTNAMMTGVLVTILLFIISVIISKRRSLVPSRFQTVIEMIVEGFLGLLESITGSKKSAKTLLPLIGTLFVFIAVGNLIALIPGLTSITYEGRSLFRTATNDFNLTFSIALAMVLYTNFASLKEFGIFGHLGKFFKFKGIFIGFKKGMGEGVLAIVDFLIGLLDIVSELAKVISLSLRLFGNMYAGDVLAAILLGALAVAVPAPWLAMNLLVGILQALVFGALTAAYYSLAVASVDEEAA